MKAPEEIFLDDECVLVHFDESDYSVGIRCADTNSEIWVMSVEDMLSLEQFLARSREFRNQMGVKDR